MRWPDRCRTWFFGAGGTLDPVSGRCRWTDEQLAIPVKKLKHYIDAAQQGTFVPDRENDELTMALGNPEHPGRTRGTPGSIPWKVGFPDAGGYKSHERRKKVQQTQMQALQARVDAIEEREANRSKRTAEASPEATPPSQRRSSVASTELLQQVACCELRLVPLVLVPLRAAPAVRSAALSSSSRGICNRLHPETQPSTERSLACLVSVQGPQDFRGPL